ncbi:hypothetical protein AADZ91_12495 [Colwelliaceae bacterium 6441]
MRRTMIGKKIKVVLLITFITSLLGCDTKNKEENAEDIAISFFNALYNEKDLKKVKELSSKNFQSELAKYHTAKHVANKLFHLSFDKVKIDAALADTKLRAEFNEHGVLTVIFNGEFNRKTIKEMKRIRLIRKGDTWLVDQILPDVPFS